MKKFTLFLFATLFSALSFAALNPYAYGLSSKLSDDEKTVTITYKLNAPATAVSVVVLDGETVLKTQSSTGITQGEHSVAISTDGFPKGKTLTWKVEVKGAGVTDIECTNDISGTTTKYKFYRPQGVAVDNNPESDFFGRIYIALPRGGYDHTKGVVVFDPVHNVLSNSGITATGVALASDDTYGMHRIAVNPTNGKVYYAKSETSTAIYELTPDATNILSDGGTAKNVISGMSTITNANSLCFDKNGAMYVLGNAGYASATDTYTGKIYKIENGTISEFTKEYYRWASKDNSIVSDERGGFWVAQQRTNFDGCDVLAHVNSKGTRDYKITSTVNNTLLPTKTSGSSTNASYRGQVAHYLIDGNNGILAFGGGGKVSIFKVTYAADEVPTLTAWKTISLKSTSWKANVDGLAFDYAGNLIVMSATDERFGHYALPKENNTCITPCPSKHAFSLKADPQLNPFAYALSSELSTDEKNLTIKYSLNAKATSVNWVLLDGNNVVKTVDLASWGLEKGDYTTTIPTTDFPQCKKLTWKIEVKGVAVNEPTHVKAVNFYRPFGVDIDNNPENPHFGRILCGETYTSSETKYDSYGVGAGIYEYSPAFELKPNGSKPGYNAGKAFTNSDHSPYRIRISEDGRIFVTAHDQAGEFLWEVNPDNLNEWTSVFQGATHNTSKLLDASGKFIAGTNAGFDVRGKGENLQLLMLSCNNLGTSSATFQCHEYNLGEATEWSIVPTRSISGTQLHSSMIARYSQVTYDKDGGFWCIYYINTTILGGIAHFTKEGIKDYEKHGVMLRAGACIFNHDFSKLLLCGDIDVKTNTPGYAVVYNVSKDASGNPVLTKETTINTGDVVGGNLNDFAWDYANNIYAVGNNGEKLSAYAMPHSSEDVVATPAASKYAFSVGKYTVTALTNDENKGTVTGGGEYLEGDVVTLTATPKEGYELLYWSDRSKENPRNITVDGNEALSAYFIKKNDVEPTFSITKVWENTNVPTVNTNGYQAVGWDGKIYLQASADSKIMVYDGTGAATEYATSGAGYQIAVDEVGNLIVYNGYFATATPNNILIYAKGSTTGKELTFTLPNPGRCDFFSASGDIYSAEGGYVYFYCNTQTVVNRLKIKNGAATAADVTTDVVGGSLVDGCTQNHVVVDIFGNLLAQSRLNGVRAVNVHTDEAKSFFLPEHKTSTLGGCSFELGGKEFWAYNVGTKAYTSEWKLYNITDKTFLSETTLYAKNTTETNKNQAANWLNVQVVDENTAYIYQYCPTVAVALWKVSRDIKYNVSATAENGTVTGAGKYKEGTTATLTATPNARYDFVNWTKGGIEVSTDATYSFEVTEDVELVANFSKKPDIAYELNGGQWNKYGWTSKKDMYDELLNDWRAYSGSSRTNVSYETQFGIGNSSKGIPTTIASTDDRVAFWNLFTDATYAPKWGWLATYVDAVAATQYKKMDVAQGIKTQPTSAAGVFTFTIGNFFGEDNAHTIDYIDAVDFTGAEAHPDAFQPTWGHLLSNPTQPTTTIELGNPYREGHDFGGWYETADFTGAAVTTIDENTVGTFYAKWNLVIDENAYNNSTVLAPYEGESVTVTVKRNFASNKCYTLTLPFDMNASQIEDVFGNATVYEFYNLVEHNAEELYLEFIPTSSIQAGKPCLVVTPSGSFDANDGFMIENVIISTTPQPVQVGAVTMMPVLDNGYLMDDPSEYYVWDGGLYCAGTYNMTSKGLRAYFTSSSPLPVRARVVLKDNEATSIPLIGVETGTQVRKIMKDGQIIIIIRGEEQYNIQGQRME